MESEQVRAVIQRVAAGLNDATMPMVCLADVRFLLDFALACSAGKRRAEFYQRHDDVRPGFWCEACYGSSELNKAPEHAWDEARWLAEERKLYRIE